MIECDVGCWEQRMRLSIYCADIGSVARNRFGWAARRAPDHAMTMSVSIADLVKEVAKDLSTGLSVALGFECPLFVPLPDDPVRLTRARAGEGNRPWSAGAGAGALATGLTETTWILSRLRERLACEPSVFFDWDRFRDSSEGALFLWEAFVSGKAKGATHIDDASAGVDAFRASLPNPATRNLIKEEQVFSLIGASLLRAGWQVPPSILSEPCLVLAAAVRKQNDAP